MTILKRQTQNTHTHTHTTTAGRILFAPVNRVLCPLISQLRDMKCHHGLFCPVSNGAKGVPYDSGSQMTISVRDLQTLDSYRILMDCEYTTADRDRLKFGLDPSKEVAGITKLYHIT